MKKVFNKSTMMMVARKAIPISGSIGMITDVASPLANFSDYLTASAGLLAIGLGVYWIWFFDRTTDWSMEKGFMPRALAYAGLATMVFGLFSIGQTMSNSEDRGMMAKIVPGIAKLQESVFRIEKTTKEMNAKLDRIEDQMDRKYSLNEMQLLADQEMWDEAMAHLEDTPPLQRDEPWRKILEQVAVGWLYDMDIHEDIDHSYKQMRDLFQKFKVLKKSPEAMEYRRKIGMRYLEKCLNQRNPIQDCHPLSIHFIKYDRNSVEKLAFEVGKLTTYYRLARGAIDYFHMAINETNKDQYCGEDRLHVAIENGFVGGPGENMNMTIQLANLCFPQLKEKLVKELSQERMISNSTTVICDLFETHGEPNEHCGRLKKAKEDYEAEQEARSKAYEEKKNEASKLKKKKK